MVEEIKLYKRTLISFNSFIFVSFSYWLG